jgi:hypothetical protein
MPIIINEIEIAVEVIPDSNIQGIPSAQIIVAPKDEIIKECIEKIMEMIKQKYDLGAQIFNNKEEKNR